MQMPVKVDQQSVRALEQPSRALSEFLAGLRYEDIPAEVVSRTEDLFLDWIVSALAGKGARPTLVMERFALLMGPASGPAEVLTSRGRTSAWFAALINAAASHFVEQDDLLSTLSSRAGGSGRRFAR